MILLLQIVHIKFTNICKYDILILLYIRVIYMIVNLNNGYLQITKNSIYIYRNIFLLINGFSPRSHLLSDIFSLPRSLEVIENALRKVDFIQTIYIYYLVDKISIIVTIPVHWFRNARNAC